MAEFKKELEGLLASNYPLLAISTHEETRVNLAINEVANGLEKKHFIWTITGGLQEVQEGGKLQRVGGEELREPRAVLDTILKGQIEVPAVIVLCDFNTYLKDSFITRLVRENARMLPQNQQTIIFTGPVWAPPAELQREVTEVEFPLPDKKEIGSILEQMIKMNEEKPVSEAEAEKILAAATGLTSNEIENAFAKSLYENKCFEPKAIIRLKAAVLRKGLLEYYEPEAKMEDVGGFSAFKAWVELRVKAFTKEAAEFGIKAPRGCLITGIPGCGKSLVAKAIGNLWMLPLLRLDMGKIFGSLVGQSESNLREALKVAESMAPCIIWLDEIEKALAGSQSSGHTDSGVSARVFGGLLTWMQEKKTSCFIIATANNIEALPPELLRKGRFDELFWVDLPTEEERKEIFKIHLAKRKRESKKFDLETLVSATKEFTGSEIEEVINSGLFLAFAEGKELETRHIQHSIKNTVPLSTTMKAQVETLRGWAKGRAVNVGQPEALVAGSIGGRKVSKPN